ncbi:DUF1553 domain-containing protein [Blastopirellula marina]|uniref:Cytochrome c domain-containing protein n=1 Tax=Blastopirellula marina TaxID=124 RepID=A0A2S8F4F3_9BACT|nr:DUF1553 domain-containing protein [Blastopirellula marina]PQO27038.1 hypothetical protein C5Y98_27670 [Blastopirellula marina]PTL41185.1 DUF1553 domain-containing protein [Blastopirellula marina]
MLSRRFLLIRASFLAACIIATSMAAGLRAAERELDFARDVQPILARTCYECHGPDASARKADVRFDRQADALRQIEPGEPEHSELYRRLVSSDPDVRMPPPSADRQPTLTEIATLKRWIEEGAPWEGLWSFQPLHVSEVPEVQDPSWGKNPLDRFVLARLEEEGLRPAPPASKHQWLRRVTFDLTGLPPTKAEIEAYLADDSAEADQKVIERLLASPAYGENFAREWLDLARYADTHGYSIDGHRDLWRYRDWLIDALNRNISLADFTTLQLAGDLIEQPTIASMTATGFHRNTPVNDEMGAIAEEYRHAYVVDRVNTTGTIFLGMTLSCAQCHDHKYDPISQKDFYRLAAYFDNIDEKGLDGKFGNAAPLIKSPLPEQQLELDKIEQQILSTQQAMDQAIETSRAKLPQWEAEATHDARPLAISNEHLIEKLDFDQLPLASQVVSLEREEGQPLLVAGRYGEALLFDGKTCLRITRETNLPLSVSVWIYPTINSPATLYHWQSSDGQQVELRQKGTHFSLTHISTVGEVTRWEAAAEAWETNEWQHLAWSIDPAEPAKTDLWVRGKHLAWSEPTTERQEETLSGETAPENGETLLSVRGLVDQLRLDRRRLTDDDVAVLQGGNPIQDILALAPDQRTEEQTDRLVRYFVREKLDIFPQLERQKQRAEDLLSNMRAQLPETMVMRERDVPRTTHVHVRGEWDQLGEEVTPGVPTQLFSQDDVSGPNNRLALARWLTDSKNPLPHRVWVNRAWQHFFGTGIVKTVDDFGTRGDLPSHPALLEYLAWQLANEGDMKAIHRLIVSSATYRQTSQAGRDAYQRDPENRLLGRGPRLRLSAEEIRDQALVASGLLVEEIGGRSMKPYQPPGLWEEISIGDDELSAQKFVQDHGQRLYRRSLYTYWKRSSPPPNMTAFDAPNREVCVAQRSRTNTPTQALVLLNDVTFVEAAKVLAADVLATQEGDTEKGIEEAFLRIVSRPIEEEEFTLLKKLHEQELARFQASPEATEALLSAGETVVESSAEVAAMTVVCHTIFNLDEAIVTP